MFDYNIAILKIYRWGQMFWFEQYRSNIMRSNFNGSNVTEVMNFERSYIGNFMCHSITNNIIIIDPTNDRAYNYLVVFPFCS